ncbi:MAG: TonB-dependent receptor [Bacteroidales bacterium]|nr:TonB-dependent receptor [Bacteroidales bacterium]
MFKKVLMTIGLLLMANFVLAQGIIKGAITDPKTKEPVPFANVVAQQDGKTIKSAQTDINGEFMMKGVPVGQYTIKASCVGFPNYERPGFTVKASGVSICNIEMTQQSIALDVVNVVDERISIIDVGDASSGKRMGAEEIAHMPGNSIDNVVAAVGGVGYNDGGTSSARGEEGMVTMTNGVRKRTGVNVPKEAIQEIQVILGGTPASIGEAIGGTQIITLKPPTGSLKGSIRYDALLDYRMYNNLNIWLSGPVIRTKIKDPNTGEVTGDKTLVGFRFTADGRYSNNGFYRPKGYRYQVVNDALVQQFEQSPIAYDPVNGTVDYAAESGLYASDFVTIKNLTAKDFSGDKTRVPKTQSYSISTQLAFDVRFNDQTQLTVTGDLDFSHSPENSLMPLNMSRCANNVSTSTNWDITVDFTQSFTDSEEANANNTDGQSSSAKLIKDIKYNITAMFNRAKSHTYNEVFGGSIDDVFKYGYNGSVQTNQLPSYELVPSFSYNGISRAAFVQNSWVDLIDWSTYEPFAGNQVYANYNLQLLSIPDIANSITNIDVLRYYKGLANGDTPGNIYGLLNNVGAQGTTYATSQTDYIYVSAKAGASIKDHNIELGFQYDRMNQSSYQLGAFSLWTIMRQNANVHISQMDLNNPHYRWEGSTLYVDYDRYLNSPAQSHFDKAMRDYLGWSGNYEGERSYLDIDRYKPEDYVAAGGMDMFSADELFNNGSNLVAYYGYDHTGKKYNAKGGWDLDKFYNLQDGKYRYLPEYTPTYMAGYIQDEFYFSDLIFNVGVRVDVFDAEQYVLKDPYLLYESYTVGDLRKGKAVYNGDIYDGAADNWVVYVDAADAETPSIMGYRSGSTWYNANGIEQANPNSIVGASGKPTPYRTPNGQRALRNNTVGSEAFEDYTPQVVVMPRIAFSFPVGEKSQFQASYDIIARRPSSNWRADYLSYYYMSQKTYFNNPNLKPERITNYELGFQQALTDKMAISISAYYKETRDLIQLVQYAGADPNTQYYSYDNIDFKTIKGLTVSYDVRQLGNMRINANYTLQYAEGTGLTATTMTELIKEGYTTIKMLNPIGDDRRHEFKVNLDYRYGMGKKYTGPKIERIVKDTNGVERKKTINVLENFGVNFMAVAQSGRPYTKAFSHNQGTIVGSYNGARLPWGFYFDVVLDKAFPIKVKKHQTNLILALTISNLFNIRNTTSVFPVTGNPEDDGYLTDPETQTVINNYLDPLSYRDLYAITSMNGYWRHNSPRTFRLSLAYSF